MELFAFRDASLTPTPDETIDMKFAKDNAAEEGFNRWSINGTAYPMTSAMAPASFHLKQGKRYRIRMRNASDDIHPIHLQRHSFELTSVAGSPNDGIVKDVVMLGGYQEAQIDFSADNPGFNAFPLLPTIAHGLRFHDVIRLRVGNCQTLVFDKTGTLTTANRRLPRSPARQRSSRMKC